MGEGPREADVERFGVARYFSYYEPDELTAVVAHRFTVLRVLGIDIPPRPSLAAIARIPAPVEIS